MTAAIILQFGVCACSAPYDQATQRMNGGLHKTEGLEQFRSPVFIEDPGYLPSPTAQPEDVYLRVFGRFDNLERLFKDSPERITKTNDSILVAGDGGMLVNEKLTLLGPTRFRLEKDRGENTRLHEVYNYNGEGWLLESWYIQ